MSQGRKERTPAQLAVLAQTREKAKIVIAERAKLNAQAKKHEPVSEEDPSLLHHHPSPPEPEPLSEEATPEPVPPKEDSDSENEDEEPRLTRPKYHYINGMYMYIKIK